MTLTKYNGCLKETDGMVREGLSGEVTVTPSVKKESGERTFLAERGAWVMALSQRRVL